MIFTPLNKNGSSKRRREAPLAENRPLKKSSPVPNKVSLPIGGQSGSKCFGISTPIKDVIRKCSAIRHGRDRKHDESRRQVMRELKVSTKNTDLQEPVTPENSPLRSGNGSYWESKRIQSTGQLAISSPVPSPNAQNQSLSKDFADLTLTLKNERISDIGHRNDEPHEIFQMKEILENILSFVSEEEDIPQEKIHSRRKPLSRNHAMLIYKDEEKANQVWKECVESLTSSTLEIKKKSNLYSCLVVNKLWHSVALELLLKRIYFRDPNHYIKFVNTFPEHRNKRMRKPSVFVLHKFHRLLQGDLNKITEILAPTNITWLEFYICPHIVPPLSWITKLTCLEKLILPGNKVINDNFLIQISGHVPSLKTLDLRACDNITDSGVVAIALRCLKLKSCNLGRHRNGNTITSVSVIALAKHTNLETLGVAGCEVTDAGIWELAQLRGTHIRRLSLNNCNLLTNHSIPTLFAFNYFPNLSVLEIRNIEQINDLRQIALFKLWKRSLRIPVLIEGCERITKLLYEEESEIKRAQLALAVKDMNYWVNKDED